MVLFWLTLDTSQTLNTWRDDTKPIDQIEYFFLAIGPREKLTCLDLGLDSLIENFKRTSLPRPAQDDSPAELENEADDQSVAAPWLVSVARESS